MEAKRVQVLHIHLVRAGRLKIGDVFSSDPYVRIYWEGDGLSSKSKPVQSRVISSQLDPVWNEDLVIDWKYPDHTALIVDVFDKDPVTDDFLGRARIPIPLMTSSEVQYNLGPRSPSDTGITGFVVLSFIVPKIFLRQNSGFKRIYQMMKTPGGSRTMLNAHLNEVDKQLDGNTLFQMLEEKLGIPKAYLGVLCIFMFIMFVVFGWGSRAACLLIGAVYPTYASFKAVKTVEKDDDSQWLIYWVVYSFFILVESFTDALLFWIPFYYFTKVLFLIYLMHPATRGAGQLYLTVIAPFLQKTEEEYVAANSSLVRQYGSGSVADRR